MKISFVLTGRNDNYGGNLLHRFQVFINGLYTLMSKHKLEAEFILVEWNPPQNVKNLHEEISWPNTTKIRVIKVPKEIHDTFPNSDRIPMFEYIAKNVGIRRANGEFILSTNPDVLFTDALIKYLARENLDQSSFYRVDRYDVQGIIPLEKSIYEQLQYARRNCVTINTLGESVNVDPSLPFIRKVWQAKYHISIKKRIDIMRRRRVMRIEDKLHTNAAGDFFLMSSQNWHRLRGYHELSTHSHIDSYLCCIAKSAGLKQVILKRDKRIFHQEHSHKDVLKRPLTSYELWSRDCESMLSSKKPLIVNDENWGLGDKSLPEVSY